MSRDLLGFVAACTVVLGPSALAADSDDVASVIKELNDTSAVVGSPDIKSFSLLFDAYLQLQPPPMEVGPSFDSFTIHPGMRDWVTVSGWAESNPEMATALLGCEEKTMFGLPYGADEVKAEYRAANLVADIGVGGSLRDNRFPYIQAIDTISAFATAESYRLLEAGKIQEGLDLAVANIFMVRQCCDRQFITEQIHSIALLSRILSNLRDMFHAYQDQITADQFGVIASQKLPYLRPDRSRLLIPEGDRIVAAALISEVFTRDDQPDDEQFASSFAEIQSKEAPLTRFGAARRWRMIAEVHDSKTASLDRLTLVYDDWYRRWRVQEHDPILDIPTQFERTNPVRYAAVIHSLDDMEDLFAARNVLLASVYGTAVAGGLCGYKAQYGTYPSDQTKMYVQFVRKRSDRDPFDREFRPFKYRVLNERFAVQTSFGRVWLEPDSAILYSRGNDHEDGRGSEHTLTGEAGDVVLWPPLRALLRETGQLD